MTTLLDHPALREQPSRRSLLAGGLGASAAALLTAGAGAGSASAGGWTNPQAHIFATAKTRAGAPYVTGAAGNWAFDCSGLVMWDFGTPAPPAGNVPPRKGDDPHGKLAGEPGALAMVAAFIGDDHQLIDVCDAKPCVTPAE